MLTVNYVEVIDGKQNAKIDLRRIGEATKVTRRRNEGQLMHNLTAQILN